MWQSKRSCELELIDLGPDNYSDQEYGECLTLLTRINRYFGGFKPIFRCIKSLKLKPTTILDIGCGEGTLSLYLHQKFPEADILGIDLSEAAINQANGIANDKLSFAVQKEKSLDFPDNRFDVVTTLLVCHHMTDEELVPFLKECHRICRKAVIINDLHRHFIAYLLFSLTSPILFANRLIWLDGRLSIRRAFHKSDWIRLMDLAGFQSKDYSLKWHWPFRWTVTLRKE